ncbi:hypothetical protein [Citricoccus sp. NR2]|uniref:hypothetical protein n=1 Tax=Citricoccus sp. NR2 TaxID=3004095 RepID=UPI0022DDDD85|nr:hypothetical protein [Citricoccus sp. NR2]WBL19986.1 hypothetical protein O1A05_04670 [Citricoccus sp. NR2]
MDERSRPWHIGKSQRHQWAARQGAGMVRKRVVLTGINEEGPGRWVLSILRYDDVEDGIAFLAKLTITCMSVDRAPRISNESEVQEINVSTPSGINGH